MTKKEKEVEEKRKTDFFALAGKQAMGMQTF